MARRVVNRTKIGGNRRRTAEVEIVLIDQVPLRRSVAWQCSAAMARLEKVRSGWHQFEREDRPGFVRWRAREFGALLSKAREVEDRIRDAQALIHEVEMELRRHIQDPRSAYHRVMYRRQNPGAAMETEREYQGDRGPAGGTRKLSEFEQETLFQEWVQKFLGTNPDKMDDEAYSSTFEVFKSHMFRAPPEEPRSQKRQRRAEEERIPRPPEPNPHEEVPDSIDPRVKELYRRLVRRLHPDLRADGSAAVSALWHEVQEAYAASDIARMELLLALSDIESQQLGEATSLFQMRSVLEELNRACRALEKSLREAEGEDAWNFARSGPSDHLCARVERQLKHDLSIRMERLELLGSTIASWAEDPFPNAEPKRRATASVRHVNVR
jgi:hypothetical protein